MLQAALQGLMRVGVHSHGVCWVYYAYFVEKQGEVIPVLNLEKHWQKGVLSVLLVIGLCYGGSLRAQLKKEEVDFEVLDVATVMPGPDCCLWDMAAKYYGDPYKWTILKEVNKIPNEEKISEGTVIYIPKLPIKKMVEEPGQVIPGRKPPPQVVKADASSRDLIEEPPTDKRYFEEPAPSPAGERTEEKERSGPSDDGQYNATVEAFYRTQVLEYEHRLAAFRWQLLSSKIIFAVVIVVVMAGLYFSGVHFHKGLRSKRAGSDQTQLEASVKGIKVSSPILGIIILAISLLFLYLYLAYIYPIHIIEEEQVVNGETKATVRRFLRELPAVNNGRIARILDCDVGLVSQIRREMMDAGELQRHEPSGDWRDRQKGNTAE